MSIKKASLALLLIVAILLTALPAFADGDPTFAVDEVSAKPGDTVTVKINVVNNPGIASIKLEMTFDDDLTLETIEYNKDIGGMSMLPQTNDSPVILNWFNGAANSEGDWTFATLTFTVADNARTGEHPINITYTQNNVYNIDEEDVYFAIQNGSITVSVDPTGVNLSETDLKLHQGASKTLTATVTPPNASQSVTWKSDHPNVATVDASGKVTAVSGGAATITATTADGKRSASCVVTVEPHTFTGAYQTDAENHWQLCACGEQGPKTAHTFEWVVDKPATSEDTGLKHEECTVCGYKRNENTVIPKHEHTLEKVPANPATHFADGNIEYWKCTECGQLFADPEGKTPISKEDTIDPMIPHTFGEEWTSDATNHWHECTCGEKSDVAAHTFGEWEVTKEATANESGSRKRICTVCGYEQVETIPVDRPVLPDLPVPTTAPSATSPASPSTTPSDPPKTGDPAAPALWASLAGLSVLAALAVALPRRNKHE